MASRFDPSAFIEAEREQVSQTLAAVEQDLVGFSFQPETAEICAAAGPDRATVARIAAIAGVAADALPWAQDLEAFVDRPCPADVRPEYWDELTNEAWSISRQWGATACAAGWSSLDIFACNPDPSARRVDRDGLVLGVVGMIAPMRVIDVTSEYAALQDRHGSVLRHRPSLRAPGAVHLWEAYPMIAGP